MKRLYALVFQRAPSRRELAAAREFLRASPTPVNSGSDTTGSKSGDKTPSKESPKPSTPWEQYAQVLLAANEFAFVD